MCRSKSIKNIRSEHGFSLLELAIVMVMIGLVIAPAISIYHTQRIKADWEGTENHVDTSVDEIGGFRSVYGHYPCPASLTAVPGDLNYGHEDCTVHPFGTCVGGTCTFASNIVGQQVLTGAIPFKTLNLQESEVYDKYLNRLGYAVTLALTDSTTFDLTGGGISIVDKTPVSIIDPPHRGHFVVLSHGQNQIGGTTKAGVLSAACLSGTPLEQENCDIDATFRSGEIDNDFDDRIGFFSGVAFSEWQISQGTPKAIHLKNANSISIGATTATDLGTAEKASIHGFAVDNGGSILASNIRDANEGLFFSDQLCIYGADDPGDKEECFRPRRFAGDLTWDSAAQRYHEEIGVLQFDRDGMSCFIPVGQPDAQDEFLVGIRNGEPICEPEIYISCPDGQFITGIDPNGVVQCSDALGTICQVQNIQTTCNTTRTMPLSSPGTYQYEYSGLCHQIADYDAAYFTAQLAGFTTTAEVTALIDGFNAAGRTDVECGETPTDSLVRDRYQCNAGNWDHIIAHEKRDYWRDFPSNPNTGGSWIAENDYSGDDNNNNNYRHDCWCREDYRVDTYGCGGGQSGTRVVIRKHTCPQTSHSWTTILNSSEFCGCTPHTQTTTQTCNSYYEEINDPSNADSLPTTGLTGNVTHTFDVTCMGNTPVTPPTPTTTDTSDCQCPANPDTVVRSYCPQGLSNDWTSTYGAEEGVSGIDITNWTCPGTITNGLPDPGSIGTTTAYTPTPPACTCDSDLTSPKTLLCDAGLEGTGMVYEREWDCVAGDWEAQDDWELKEDNCHPCSWRSTGVAISEEFPYGGSEQKVGKTCACGSTPADQCWDYGSPFDIWTNCPCVPQMD